MFGDTVVFLIIAAFVSGSILKIISDKRKGIKCSGCPLNKVCASKNKHSDKCPLRSVADSQTGEKE